MADADARPLAGRRIAITRAREQADDLAARLEEAGGEAMFLPMLRFLDPEPAASLDRAIESLGEFGWIIFTSANAVRFFLKRCRLLGHWPDPEDGPPIAAVGAATRGAVDAANLRASVVPGEFNGAALATSLGKRVAGKKVLLPRSDLASNELPELLRAAKAEVVEVIAYRAVEAEIDSATLQQIRGCDAVTFFSPSAFRNFAKALGGAEAARALNDRVAFAAVGPVTAAEVRNSGAVVIEANEASGGSLVAALAVYFSEDARKIGRKGSDHVSH